MVYDVENSMKRTILSSPEQVIMTIMALTAEAKEPLHQGNSIQSIFFSAQAYRVCKMLMRRNPLAIMFVEGHYQGLGAAQTVSCELYHIFHYLSYAFENLHQWMMAERTEAAIGQMRYPMAFDQANWRELADTAQRSISVEGLHWGNHFRLARCKDANRTGVAARISRLIRLSGPRSDLPGTLWDSH